MPRKPRALADGGYHHLLARGNNRLFLFEAPDGFETFQRLLARSKTKYPWRLSHYCVMANHLHLLGQITRGPDLPKLCSSSCSSTRAGTASKPGTWATSVGGIGGIGTGYAGDTYRQNC